MVVERLQPEFPEREMRPADRFRKKRTAVTADGCVGESDRYIPEAAKHSNNVIFYGILTEARVME